MARATKPANAMTVDDRQPFLLAMYKEQCDQARQHENMRQQSTTLLLTLAAACVAVESGLITATLGRIGGALEPVLLASYAAFGLIVFSVGLFGRLLSLKHYERNRQHIKKARAYRRLMEERHPESYKISEARNPISRELREKREEPGGRVFRYWSGLYGFVIALGVALTVAPLTLAFAPRDLPQSEAVPAVYN